MRCESCGFANPEELKFCEECGTQLLRVCPNCGQQVRPTAKFCGHCGTTLGAEETPAPAKSRRSKGAKTPGQVLPPQAKARSTSINPQVAAPEAERRQLTVMFCDLVGSTPLAEKLDPEDLRQVILAYQQMCAEEIQRFEGHLARYIGDGLLVYFGYPQAHEDDAQRAIRAGLSIVAALPELNSRVQQTVPVLRDFPLQVRIGIHTGLVVVGEMGGGGYRDPRAIVGETPNIAARVQGIAEPNTVVISEATARLVQGLFMYQARGPQRLKGVSTPVAVYRVLGESETQSRFEAAVSKGLTPLVGREEELGRLRRGWEQAQEGSGQVVLLSGEPGIGKSRLVQALREQLSAEGATQIEFRCSAYHQNSAFYPIIAHLQRLLQFAREDAPGAKLEKLQHTLRQYRFPQHDTLPLLAALLLLPHPEGCAPLTFSPQKQKQKTQAALVAWIVEEAEKTAVCCVWEDLHWADPSTLEVLSLYLDQAPATRLLVLLTFRPEFRPPWGNRSHLSPMMLNRLARPHVATMIEKVTGGKALPPEVLDQVVSKTDGVPLFVEELTKMVVESGLLREEADHYELTSPLPPLAIPSTLQDSLMARLDRLALGKEVVQLGATLGREFSYDVLQAISAVDEGTLQDGLKQLVEAELVYQRGIPPRATYLFKHALIQDTAYQSLLKSTRQHYHQQIAQVLEAQFHEIVETQPELVAHHYTEAGLIGQAIPYWQRAGQQAVERSANVEALSHLTKGLELLKTVPNTSQRAQQELTLQTTLGPALMTIKGYAAPEVGKVYARTQELCRELGETPQLFWVLIGLWGFRSHRAELQTARELAEKLLSLAQSVRSPTRLRWAHNVMGQVLFYLGEFALAQDHLEQSIALYDPRKHSPLVSGAMHYPTMASLGFASRALWHLGYPDRALKRSQEAVVLAQELSHPHSLAFALNMAAWLHQFRRERQAVQDRAGVLLALSSEQGFVRYLVLGTLWRDSGLAEQGQGEEGVARLCQDLVAYRATGSEIYRPYFLTLLVEAYGRVGQMEEGLAVLAEALAVVDKTGEHFYEAELYRLKGELTLKQSSAPGLESRVQKETEACFQKAIEIARHQQAKSLELRAVMSLSRLWQQQGKRAEARQMLADIYGWFTEGFDTKDLQEAKALLAELAEGQ